MLFIQDKNVFRKSRVSERERERERETKRKGRKKSGTFSAAAV